METEIVVTGIVKSVDEFLVVKRSESDSNYPGVWEFPGGHVEDGETIKEALERELSEEHTEYKWVLKNSDLLDDYIKSKLVNVN